MTVFDISEWEQRTACFSDMQGHMEFLRKTAASYSSPVIAEFGVRTGNSTACFLAGLRDAGCGQLWSVDTEPPQVPAHWHQLPHWRFLQADDTGVRAQQWVPPALDVLFIDTYHQYDHTLLELGTYYPRVRAGGVILLHDTEWEQIGDTADQCRQLDVPGGSVTAALNTFCKQQGISWENRPGSYGIGIIRR